MLELTMLTELKPKIEPAINVLAKPFMGVNPNVLTALGIIPPILFFVFILQSQFLLAIAALLGSAFDFLDGAIARATGRVSAFGGLLDSTVDRIADILFIAAFGFAGVVRWELVIPAISLAYLTSYIRSRAELAANGSFKLAVGLVERSERLIIVALAVISIVFIDSSFNGYNLTELVFLFLILASAITCVQRLVVAYQRLSSVKQ